VLDAKPETLRREINRAISMGHLLRLPGLDGIEQIGLAARGAA
jgi:hypothetical protein